VPAAYRALSAPLRRHVLEKLKRRESLRISFTSSGVRKGLEMEFLHSVAELKKLVSEEYCEKSVQVRAVMAGEKCIGWSPDNKTHYESLGVTRPSHPLTNKEKGGHEEGAKPRERNKEQTGRRRLTQTASAHSCTPTRPTRLQLVLHDGQNGEPH
jgi:hypothetical protein